jgi:hypothetical protein
MKRSVAREGFVTGLIGAGAVAVWFLIVDTVRGEPFFTPAALGGFLFSGMRDVAAIEISFPSVIMYSMVHVLSFVVVGVIAAWLICQVERFPSVAYLVAVLFAIFTFGLMVVLGTLFQPLLGALTWWNIAIGNGFAAVGMTWYLLRSHPKLRAALLAQPDEAADA